MLIFIPDLALALEYQGQPHYFDVFVYGSSSQRKERDQRKVILSQQYGITVISIPFWWNATQEQLITLIRKKRLDILVEREKDSGPIVEEISVKRIEKPQGINSFGKYDPTWW